MRVTGVGASRRLGSIEFEGYSRQQASNISQLVLIERVKGNDGSNGSKSLKSFNSFFIASRLDYLSTQKGEIRIDGQFQARSDFETGIDRDAARRGGGGKG